MEETLRRLLRITQSCRYDMHEPDEQDFTAQMTGVKFDNAFGDDPYDNRSECTIGLTRGDTTEWFNLATLIALARTSRLIKT